MNIITNLLTIQNQIRVYHWQTQKKPGSFAQHEAFGKAYEALDPLIDDFIINEFNIRQSELPWLNSTHKDREEDWANFFVYLRLAIARILDQGRTHNRKQKILN